MLRLTGIGKRFPGLIALDKVDFDLQAGEVHVLFGENGAGKSTLSNIIAGNLDFDDGSYALFGRPVSRLSPSGARKLGIASVFQEFSLASSLSVLDNLFLGSEIRRFGMLDRGAMRARAREILTELDFHIDLNAPVSQLSRAEKQMTEIAKALIFRSRILILDEPTASLTDIEAENLSQLVHRLRAGGVGILYISHRLNEISQLADRVTVLRNGRLAGTIAADEISETKLIEMMTGQAAGTLFPDIAAKAGDVVLSVENLSTGGRVRDASLTVRSGEIVGIAGLAGCGKGSVGRAIFGLDPVIRGDILVRNRNINTLSIRDRLRHGICYFPSDRAAEGLALNRPIRENASMAALDLAAFSRCGVLRLGMERRVAEDRLKRIRLSPPAIEPSVETLSGGNRQKVLLSRGLMRGIDLFIFDEPTVGIDVGAKAEIYRWISGLAAQGAAVLFISSDLQEVLHMSSRVHVMHEGRLVAALSGIDKTEEKVLASFFGDAPRAPAGAAVQ